jgi:hypothetical protein
MAAFELVINAFTIIMVFAIPFALFAYVRYLRYKETIALAERGLLRPQPARRNRDTLRWGIIIMMLGVGLLCGLWPLGRMASTDVAVEGPATVDGVGESDTVVAPVNTGVGESGPEVLPFGLGPWMVLGALPFFFGLALVVIHWLNKREGSEEGNDAPIPAHKQVDLDEV